MYKKHVRDIKKAQKESLLLKEISQFFLQLILDDKELEGLSISRVKLSDDKSICIVFFYTPAGPEAFKEKLPKLILYKPSLRKALSQGLALRHTPDLKFKFDNIVEKQIKIEQLLDKIKTEEP